jgi:hypothetical protein
MFAFSDSAFDSLAADQSDRRGWKYGNIFGWRDRHSAIEISVEFQWDEFDWGNEYDTDVGQCAIQPGRQL